MEFLYFFVIDSDGGKTGRKRSGQANQIFLLYSLTNVVNYIS